MRRLIAACSLLMLAGCCDLPQTPPGFDDYVQDLKRRCGNVALSPAAAKGWRLVGRGVLMSMSNPLTILFFLAFLPNFTREGTALSPAVQVLLLGTLFCALVPFIYFPVILAADFFRTRLMGSASATATLKLVSALMLAAVAAILCASVH